MENLNAILFSFGMSNLYQTLHMASEEGAVMSAAADCKATVEGCWLCQWGV
jgi:hypothetical protein